MNSKLRQRLQSIICFLLGMVAALFLSYGLGNSHAAVATETSVDLVQPSTTGLQSSADAHPALSTWRNPTHQELNYYQ